MTGRKGEEGGERAIEVLLYMGHKGATVFSMSQPPPRGLFAPSNGGWATFQIGPLCDVKE